MTAVLHFTPAVVLVLVLLIYAVALAVAYALSGDP